MKSVNDILAEAQRLAEGSKTWADLSNVLFDPMDGLVTKRFPDAAERAEFRKTADYEKLHQLVERKMEQTGVVAGSEPKKSGRFIVRVPKSLHTALEREAHEEGTSLNQLVLAKLAARFGSLASGTNALLIQAFAEVRDGFSADRVVADPQVNRLFLRRCRELGLSGTDYDLNWRLLNARKASLLSDLPKTKIYTVTETDLFEYGCELAVRHLQLTKKVSLDHIICDPDLAQEFDRHAAKLAPGYTPLQYRWSALGLRKAGRLRSDATPEFELPKLELIGSVQAVKPSVLSDTEGLYLFSSGGKPVYLSQTEKLRQRIERHLEVSKSRGLPEWLWDQGPLDLSIATTPGHTKVFRQTAELLLIRQMHPVLNYQRAA